MRAPHAPPSPGAFWELIEKHRITIFYTAPTVIRAFMRAGRQIPDGYDLSSLRLLGHGGGTHQPGGLDVVSGGDRWVAAAPCWTLGGRQKPAA